MTAEDRTENSQEYPCPPQKTDRKELLMGNPWMVQPMRSTVVEHKKGTWERMKDRGDVDFIFAGILILLILFRPRKK